MFSATETDSEAELTTEQTVTHERWMREALRVARDARSAGEVPVGTAWLTAISYWPRPEIAPELIAILPPMLRLFLCAKPLERPAIIAWQTQLFTRRLNRVQCARAR